MKLTKSQQNLVNDAEAAGYTLKAESNRVFLIKKNGKARPKGVVIYEDGTAYRTDIEPGQAITIRTQKVIRQILGI